MSVPSQVRASVTPTQQRALDELRGSAEDRPSFADNFSQALQVEMESRLEDITTPVILSKFKLNQVHQCEGRLMASLDEPFAWSVQKARGTLVHKAIELSVGGNTSITPDALVQHATERVLQSSQHESLAEWLCTLDAGESAELRAACTDLVIKFQETMPPLSAAWAPSAEASTAAWLFGGRIRFTGKIDLRLGRATGTTASTLIIDFKTGSPAFSDLEDLRFYALTETLRAGVPPFRWANIYLDAGQWQTESVNEDILWSAARRASDGVRKVAELENGRPPTLTPGNACRFCPARDTCPVAAPTKSDS